jgi:hypothetical protein
MHVEGKDRSLVIPQAYVDRATHIARTVIREPFTRRTWSELFYFCLSSLLAGATLAIVGATIAAGVFLAATFVGLFVIAAGLRMADGAGSWYRGLCRWLLGKEIGVPPAFSPRPGAFGCLQSALRGRTRWRALAYTFLRVVLGFAGVVVALSDWGTTFTCSTYPFTNSGDISPARSLRQEHPHDELLLVRRDDRLRARALHRPHRRRPLLRRALADPPRRLPRPQPRPRAARPGRRDHEDPVARRGKDPDGGRLGSGPPADRARSPRRHPGPARGSRHATGTGERDARQGT